MGRRKIEIKMVKDKNSRQVTFSKRRSGLFKKANELSILCGAEVAIVVFSPGNKPFSFGQPCVDVVAKRFLHQQQQHETKSKGDHGTIAGSSSNISNIDMLNQQLEDAMDQLRAEEKKGEMLDKAIKTSAGACASEVEALSSLLLLAERPVQGKGKYVAKIA